MSKVVEPCGCEWDTEPLLTYLRNPTNYQGTKNCPKHTVGTPEYIADSSWQDDPWLPRIIMRSNANKA